MDIRELDTAKLDEAIEKASRLKSLLEEVNTLISSLGETKVINNVVLDSKSKDLSNG